MLFYYFGLGERKNVRKMLEIWKENGIKFVVVELLGLRLGGIGVFRIYLFSKCSFCVFYVM